MPFPIRMGAVSISYSCLLKFVQWRLKTTIFTFSAPILLSFSHCVPIFIGSLPITKNIFCIYVSYTTLVKIIAFLRKKIKTKYNSLIIIHESILLTQKVYRKWTKSFFNYHFKCFLSTDRNLSHVFGFDIECTFAQWYIRHALGM